MPGGTRADDRQLRARGRRTLERLLEAGAKVFADRGYHAARVDDVVKAAETSHGTFYLYFSSKEELFRALAVDVAEEMLELARQMPALEPGDVQPVRDWLGRFHELYRRHGAVIRTWTEAEIVETEIGTIGGDLVVQFSEELAARVREVAPDLHSRVAALAIVGMVERAHYYLEARQIEIDADTLLDVLAEAVQAALFGAREIAGAAPSYP
jgi:AcrR family transcriptional regulator